MIIPYFLTLANATHFSWYHKIFISSSFRLPAFQPSLSPFSLFYVSFHFRLSYSYEPIKRTHIFIRECYVDSAQRKSECTSLHLFLMGYGIWMKDWMNGGGGLTLKLLNIWKFGKRNLHNNKTETTTKRRLRHREREKEKVLALVFWFWLYFDAIHLGLRVEYGTRTNKQRAKKGIHCYK